MNWKIALAFIIALLLDLTDYMVIGIIPFAGDLLDIVGIILLFPLIGWYALIPVVEFVPIIGDLTPSFVIAVLLAKMKLKPKGEGWF